MQQVNFKCSLGIVVNVFFYLCVVLDFSYIRVRLAKRLYCSLSEFSADVMSIFAKAQSINIAHGHAMQLEQWFLNQMNRIKSLQ